MPLLLLYWRYIAIAAIVGGLIVGYNVHVNGIVKQAVTKAVTERDNDWRKAEKIALENADAQARKIEAAHALEVAEIGAKYKKEIAYAAKQADARIASIHAGYRLRISAGCTSAGNDSKTPASPTGSNGPAVAQFLGEADSAFLVGEAKRADAIVVELAACQATVISDRKESQ